MAGSISVGSVTVTVVPTTKGIERSLRDQLTPAASKVGDEAGKTIGEKIKKPVSESVGAGVTEGGQKAKAPATDQGSKVGGAFADAFKARLTAAMDKLPKVDLGADSTDADRKIADLRARMAELSGKRIGVDIDAGTALAEMADIRSQLRELSRGSDVDVRVDAVRALAELDAVKSEVDRLDGKEARPSVSVDTGAALAAIRTIGIALAGLSAGPALAVGVLGGAALGAGGAAAALGVGAAAAASAPGISAVKNAYAAQQQAATAAAQATANTAASNATAASTAKQAATAALALAGAQQQLAATQRQVVYDRKQALGQVITAQQQVTSADQQLGSAELQVAQAQRASLTAQKDLTAARKQAAQGLEDLNNQVKDAALSQRADQLALAQATTQLQIVQTNPHATQAQREQAQLAYDQAVQQLAEQGIAYQRLQDQAAAANKAGVEGSKTVVAAQLQVTQAAQQEAAARQQQANAQQQQGNAQRQLADARANVTRVELNSADQIASAQRALASAQLQSATTASSSGSAVATAAAKAKAAYDALTPSEKAVYNATLGLHTAFTRWGQSLEPTLAPLAVTGMGAMQKLLPQLTPLVTGTAGAMRTLETRAVAALGSPVWRGFIADIGRSAGPALLGFGTAAGHLIDGARGIIQAVLPYAPRVIGFLDQATGKFATWGSGLGSSSGFHQFIAYAIANGPLVVKTLEDFAKAAGAVAKDLAALGPGALSINGEIFRLAGGLVQSNPGLVQWGVGLALVAKGGGPVLSTAKSLIGGDADGLRGVIKAFKSGGDEGSKFGGVLLKAKGWLGTAASSASDAAKGGWSSFTGLLSSGAGKASDLGTKVLGAAKSAGSAVGSGLSAAADVIGKGAGAAAEAAVSVGRAGAAWFITGVKAAGSGVAIAASTVATVAASAATKAWTVVQAAFNLVMDANPFVLVGIAIAALVAGIIIAYKNSATFRDVVHDAWHVIGDVVQGTWRDVIKPVFDFFASGVKAIPGAVEDAVHGMDVAWNKVKGVFAAPVNFVISTVYDDGIAGVWNAVVSHIGLSSIKLPIIAPLKFAAGGTLPPVPAGPAVVRQPRAIVGEGDPRYPEYVIPTDPRYRTRAKTLHAAAGVQLLASGGIVGDVETGLLSSATFVAKLITDPAAAWRQAVSGVLGLTGQIGGGDWGGLLGGIPSVMIDKLAGYIAVFAQDISTVGRALLGDIHGAGDIATALGSINIPGITTTTPSPGHGALPYDTGGRLPTGLTLAYNGTGRPEKVLTDSQWSSLAAAARGSDGGAASRTTHVAVYPPAASAEAVAAETVRRLQFAGIS